jgi:DNA-binding MarR family transcriptional regulator
VTNHFLVLLCIAEDPGIRMADIGQRVGITERAVQRIVADLAEAGYVTRRRVGRRNSYEVNGELPLRHHQTQQRRVRELLLLLSRDAGGRATPD